MIDSIAQRLGDAAELGRGLISELAEAGLLVVDADLRVLDAEGDAFKTLDPGELVGQRVQDAIPATAWSTLEPYYRAALSGRAQSFIYDAISAPSTHQIRIAPIREDGEVIGLMILAENVTDRVRAERALAGSERLQRSVLDVLEEGVVVVDPRRTLLQANPAALEILKLDLGHGLAHPSWWHQYGWRRPGGEPLDIDLIVLETGVCLRDIDVEVTLPDGQVVLLSVNVHPLQEDSGVVSGLVMSFRDMTDRVRTYRDLVESQERLRAAYTVARLSSWELDVETGEVMVFQALTAHHALTGRKVPLDELLAEMGPAGFEEARTDYEALVSGEAYESVSRSCSDYPGGPQWLETRMRAVRDADGKLLCVRGTTQDVTEQELAKQQTVKARDFFQTTLDSLSAHIAVLDEQGEIIMTNRAWAAFSLAAKCQPNDAGTNYLSACDNAGDDPDAARAGAGLRAIISGERTQYSAEYPCHGPGAEAWFVLRAVRFEGPGDACVVVSHEDVTERHLAQRDSATQAALLDEAHVAVVATDNDGNVTHWSRGAEDLFGWTAAEAFAKNAVALLSPPDGDGGDRYLAALLRDGQHSTEFEIQRRDGSTFPASVHGRVMRDADGVSLGRVNVSVDMSERVASERALLAARDYMSAVADSMGEGLYTLDAEGRLIYMNAAAESLLGWTREELTGQVMHDIIHSRRPNGSAYPSEECPMLRARVDQTTRRVDDEIFLRRNGAELPVAYTASPFETEDGVEGCVVVFSDISRRKADESSLQREADKLSWIGRIQDALAEDRFVLYAQPIVDLASDEVVQSELLLRMRGSDGSIIGPAEYLNVAEQYGLIDEIDRWVVERAMETAAAGRPIQINLSARSVGERSILDHIERCLMTTGADPALVVFEITETAILEEEDAALRFAQQLRSLGCKLALDDFGTGYGGFTYLKRLPVDYLKIDIEFVRDLAMNPGSQHVVKAVVGLARGFGLETVAEGVEDAEAYALLRELGVDFAQGYFIARPGPLEAEPTGD